MQELYGHPEEAGSRERLRRVFGENVAGLRSLTGRKQVAGGSEE
jgi:hypothetical protein